MVRRVKFYVVKKALGELNTSYYFCDTLQEAVRKCKQDPQAKVWEVIDIYYMSGELISHTMKSVKVA